MNKRHTLLFSLLLPLFLLSSFFCGASGLSAQEGAIAILQKGPLTQTGMPFVYPNALQVYYGEYSYREQSIGVYYTPDRIIRDREWPAAPCNEIPLFTLSNRTHRIIYFQHDTGWVVLFRVPGGIGDEDFCTFAKLFIDRFIYFRGLPQSGRSVSFPAILEF